MSVYAIDIETNNLLQDMLDFSSFPYKLKKDAELWCVVITNVDTGEIKEAVKEDITKQWLKESLSDCKFLIAHNGIKFDFIALKLFGVIDYRVGYLGENDTLFGKPVTFLDTLIISRLFNPDRFGGHSLKAWGKRLSNLKDDFRQQCIEAGVIEKGAEKGAEFRQWTPLMLEYCRQDTKVNIDIYKSLKKEGSGYDWKTSIKLEHKLADLAIRRESLGFWFDKDLAIELVEDLTNKMQKLKEKVDPILPPKPMNKGELKAHTPPKTQINKDGSLSSYMSKFIERTGGILSEVGEDFFVTYDEKTFKIPFEEPVKTTVKGTIDDLDHVKQTLIDDYNWIPTEWRERDLTKDSKKQSLPYEKRIAALERWYKETMNGKYKKLRLKELGIKPKDILPTLSEKLKKDFPVRVPTSPPIRVGVEKDLCPNLIKLGEKVEFAKDFALYLTYKHRKSSIAGGDIEEMDLEEDTPNTGFLSNYRETDGRIATPSIEIGAVTNRYTHINVANIARPSSIYGKELRSLFGVGKGNVFYGFDYSSLEARIMAHYVYKYPKGVELGEQFLAEKPNDWHSSQARAMGIERSDAKSVDYGLIYGAQIKKIMKMLGVNEKRATEIYNMFWDNSPALKALRDNVEDYWESTGKKFVMGLDGRKIMVRSKHALLNSLFQSAGIIFAKYVTVLYAKKIEDSGLCNDPFINDPDFCSMIEYHDEQDMYLKPKYLQFKTFKTKEDAKEFVSDWKGFQLSAIGEGKNGFYVALPSIVSKKLEESIDAITKFLNIKVPMGFEYMVGNNWFECH